MGGGGRVSVVGHTEQTLQKIAVSALQLPLHPTEILTFPEIRNLPEGRGLILWTCHVRQPCWIKLWTISFVDNVNARWCCTPVSSNLSNGEYWRVGVLDREQFFIYYNITNMYAIWRRKRTGDSLWQWEEGSSELYLLKQKERSRSIDSELFGFYRFPKPMWTGFLKPFNRFLEFNSLVSRDNARTAEKFVLSRWKHDSVQVECQELVWIYP